MNGLEPLIPMTLFLSAAAVFILRGPLGKALAHRLAGRSEEGESVAVAELRDEVSELRHRLEETEERLDFTERLVAQARDRTRLEPPPDRT